MMLLEREEINKFSSTYYDLCIIGSGPAGLSLALEFDKTNYKVALLEAGSLKLTKTSKKLIRYKNISDHYGYQNIQRARIFGGTTLFWGGNNLPLTKFDFHESNKNDLRKWPIRYDEYICYIDRAKKFLKINRLSFADLNKRNIGKLNKNLNVSHWIFSKFPFRLKDVYLNKIKRITNVHLYLESNFLSFKSKNNKINEISYRFGSSIKTIRAKNYVLATGGIENARILLDQLKKRNISIKHPKMLGKFFAEHPNASVASIEGPDAFKLFSEFDIKILNGNEFKPGIVINDIYKAKNNHLNGIFSIWPIPRKFSIVNNFKFLIELARRREVNFKFLFYLLISVPGIIILIPNLFQRLRGKSINLNINKKKFDLRFMSETYPNKNCYISISKEVDSMNIHAAHLSWYLSKKDKIDFKRSVFLFKKFIESEYNVDVKIHRWLYKFDSNWAYYLNSDGHVGHHMGTTRMSSSAKNGIVDKNLCVFDYSNLFIAGSSVFPSYGFANPTLSIVMLSIRLADYLKTNKLLKD